MTRPVHKSVGAEIKRRRLEHRLTIKMLAALADIHPHYLSKIERGLVDVSRAVLVRVAGALGINAALLFGPAPEFSKKTLAALRFFEKTPPEIQQAIIAILRAVTAPGRKAP